MRARLLALLERGFPEHAYYAGHWPSAHHAPWWFRSLRFLATGERRPPRYFPDILTLCREPRRSVWRLEFDRLIRR